MDYVYKFINYSNEIIYIGKTGNLKKRMVQHFTRGHLDDECYQNVNQIFFCEVEGKTNTEMMETYLINKYHPIFNIDKKYSEDIVRHSDNNVSMIEPAWKELFFDFYDNEIIASETPLFPLYYSKNMDDRDKCVAILKHNIGRMRHMRGFYKKFMPYVSDLPKMLEYFIIIHIEILKNFDVKNSSVDMPINPDETSEFVAFNINNIETINLSYLMMLSNMHLITHLSGDTYALFIHSKYVMESIPVVF